MAHYDSACDNCDQLISIMDYRYFLTYLIFEGNRVVLELCADCTQEAIDRKPNKSTNLY